MQRMSGYPLSAYFMAIKGEIGILVVFTKARFGKDKFRVGPIFEL